MLCAGELQFAVTLCSGQIKDSKGALPLPPCVIPLLVLTLMLHTCQSCFLAWT